MLTEKLCKELGKFLHTKLTYLKCYKDTIDFNRKDAELELRARGQAAWIPSYGRGSVWVDEKAGKINAGDTVVPLKLEPKKKAELKRFGCSIPYVHKYEKFGVAHIHVENCPLKDRVKAIAKLLVE